MPHLRRLIRAGAVAALAASLGAGTAVSAQAEPAASTTVRGTVTLDGKAVAGVLVGTFGGRTVLAKGRTDDQGRFLLRTPSGTPVEAFVGHNPRNARAVFTAGGAHLVSAVVGGGAPATVYEQVRSVTPSALGGGHPLAIRLRRAGRFTAAVAAGGTGGIARARDTTTARWRAEDGATTSEWLVPGAYDLRWEGDAQHLDGRSRVSVVAGRTTDAAAPRLQRGTTVRIHAASGGDPVPAGVWARTGPGSSTGRTATASS